MTSLKMLNVYVIVLFSLICTCRSQGIGRVYIGSPTSNVTASSFTFTAGGTGNIPVFIEAVNETQPDVAVPVIGNVIVTCEVGRTDTGFSNAVFNRIFLTQNVLAGSVTISGMTAGRTVDLRCYGVSQTAGVSQFTRASSISAPVSLTIFSIPTVSICTSDVLDTATQQQFTVEFSDTVTSAATVNCSTIPGTGTMVLSIPTKTAPVGVRQLMMNFRRISVGTGMVRVQCYANPGFPPGPEAVFQIRRVTMAMYPQDFTTTTTRFDLFVVLTSLPTLNATGLNCIANRFTSLSSAEQALALPSCTTTTTSTTVAPTSTTGTGDNITSTTVTILPDWGVGSIGILSPTQLPGIIYSKVSLTRNLITSVPVTEFVVTSCCTTGLAQNLNAATLTQVKLSPKPIDWAFATADGSQNVERVYQNPAYVDFAPCPCDITGNLCDLNCCCDKNCSDKEVAVFSGCIEGLPGGQAASHPEYDCQSSHFNKEDWFSLMCVEREYNSLLGYFYATTNAVRNLQNFNAKLEGEQYYSYNRPSTPTSSSTDGYKSGDTVRSGKLKADNIAIERKGVVALPQRTLTGECLNTAPVRYLKDFDSLCTHQLPGDVFSLDSSFSALSYLESTSTRNPACPNGFGILGGPNNQTVETIVNYYCATDLTPYVKDLSTFTPVTTSTLFDYNLPADTCMDFCGNDVCTDFNAIATASTETLPPLCSWDNGYTRPPVPALTVGGTWENLVLEVRYDIYWNGSSIQRLNATVIMGNVPQMTSGVQSEVTQKFKARFIHLYGGLPNATADNYREVETAFSRSGKPGYNYGLPILSGSQVINTTTNNFLYINTNSTRQMSLWNAGVDGLCFNAGRRQINFGEDTFTSCNLKIGIQDLGNCTTLRMLVINRLNNLMAADYIGRYGNPNYLQLLHWIPVTRENLTDICLRQTDASDDTILSYNVAGICTEMISGIQLDIMYGVSGKEYGQPINEIIGAHISYTTSTWQMSCATDTTVCSSVNHVEDFAVTSSVRFIKVPANTPERIPLWQEDYDESICSRDVCWEEFIYPLSKGYEGESQQYTLVSSLFILLIFSGFVVFLRPWWYIL